MRSGWRRGDAPIETRYEYVCKGPHRHEKLKITQVLLNFEAESVPVLSNYNHYRLTFYFKFAIILLYEC